ncbi:hypothetical protein L202_03538 [Cryptococcus amylolentus CBS 6039]|uniref:Uncharacterized protein n=1 Tax=Cryptococcus amylolentus CBS 6039 TaxID=1295533 RepID=A0A1E3HVJ4_9TREE|nr:hypothetical protein L202_03538 [Cryptococcus amylolentus CBS 6039]ODN79591.1 hypothetical protein L202_03538 [Cryptococcus amylolentus CBS 6039]
MQTPPDQPVTIDNPTTDQPVSTSNLAMQTPPDQSVTIDNPTTDQPVSIDPLATSSPSHSDLKKRDVVRAFAHIDNFWRRLDLRVPSASLCWRLQFSTARSPESSKLLRLQVVRSWNSHFLEATGTPMTRVGGGTNQFPDRDEGSLSVYGMGKFKFHFIEFFSKIPYVLLNLQRLVSGTVAVMPDFFEF